MKLGSHVSSLCEMSLSPFSAVQLQCESWMISSCLQKELSLILLAYQEGSFTGEVTSFLTSCLRHWILQVKPTLTDWSVELLYRPYIGITAQQIILGATQWVAEFVYNPRGDLLGCTSLVMPNASSWVWHSVFISHHTLWLLPASVQYHFSHHLLF